MDDFYEVWWKSNHTLLRTRQGGFPLTPPPPPMGPPWTLPRSVFILHLCITVLANNITWLYCFWSWRKGIYIVMAIGPLLLAPKGAMYTLYLDYLAFPTAKDDLSNIWLKFDHGFWRNRRNKYFFSMLPPPRYLLMDPIGPPLELSWIICILHLRTWYLYTQYNLTLIWWFHALLDLEKMFEIYTVFGR